MNKRSTDLVHVMYALNDYEVPKIAFFGFTCPLMLEGNPAMDQHPIQGGVEILLVASCYGKRDKLRPGGPH